METAAYTTVPPYPLIRDYGDSCNIPAREITALFLLRETQYALNAMETALDASERQVVRLYGEITELRECFATQAASHGHETALRIMAESVAAPLNVHVRELEVELARWKPLRAANGRFFK